MWEARGAAERGRGRTALFDSGRAGQATDDPGRRERTGSLELLPDGGACGSIDCAYRRILGARTQASWLGSRYRDGMAEPPVTHVTRARPGTLRGTRAPRRDTGPGAVPENSLGGMKPRRAPTRQPRPGQGKGLLCERAPGGSKASERACRLLTGEPGLYRLVDREGARKRIKPVGLANAGNRRPGSCVVRPTSWGARQRAGAPAKAIATSWSSAALAVVEREPARKQRPARAGAAPREGKAL